MRADICASTAALGGTPASRLWMRTACSFGPATSGIIGCNPSNAASITLVVRRTALLLPMTVLISSLPVQNGFARCERLYAAGHPLVMSQSTDMRVDYV